VRHGLELGHCDGQSQFLDAGEMSLNGRKWFFLGFRATALRRMEHAQPEQIELGPAIHLALEVLKAVDLALKLAIQVNRQLYPMYWKNFMNLR
jgi:hypothetical protein